MNEGSESLQEQIKKLTTLVEENQSMLKSIQRRARISILLSSVKWLCILGITFGSFFFLQPFLNNAFSAYTTVSEFANPFPKTTSASATSTNAANQMEGLIDTLREYLPR